MDPAYVLNQIFHFEVRSLYDPDSAHDFSGFIDRKQFEDCAVEKNVSFADAIYFGFDQKYATSFRERARESS